MTHECYKGAEAIKAFAEQIERDKALGMEIMDSGVLNDCIKGYTLAAVNACDSLSDEQRNQVMIKMVRAFDDMTAGEAVKYYETH